MINSRNGKEPGLTEHLTPDRLSEAATAFVEDLKVNSITKSIPLPSAADRCRIEAAKTVSAFIWQRRPCPRSLQHGPPKAPKC
jgi:hypothetical protein